MSSANSRRPSGTSATPLRATASGRPPAKRPLAEQDVAGARRDESHDRVQGRGLAGAVRADETDDLARRDLQRHAAYGGDASVRDLEIANE